MPIAFDGTAKTITVSAEATVDIREDVYTGWVDWVATADNSKYLPAMRYSGFDPVPGGFSGDIYFLINGWRLIVDFTATRVSGVLFSDDFDTAYFTAGLVPQYPPSVSALVNVVQTIGTPVITGDIAQVISQVPPAVLAQVVEGTDTMLHVLRMLLAEVAGDRLGNPATGLTIMAADGSKPRLQGVVVNHQRTVVLKDGT